MQTPYSEPRAAILAWQRAYAGRTDNEDGSNDATPAILPQALTRGASDARAAWQRWHATSVANTENPDIRVWQQVLERARAETLASKHLPGMASNLDDLEALAPQGMAFASVYRAARAMLGGKDATGPLLPDAPNLQYRTVSREGGLLGRILARLSRPVLTASSPAIDLPAITEAQARELLIEARAVMTDGGQYLAVLHPLVLWLAAHHPAHAAVEPAQSIHPQASELQEDGPTTVEEHSAASQILHGAGDVVDKQSNWPGYAVFSTLWDETLPAAHYVHPLEEHASNVLANPNRAQERKLAHRLQRRLMAARLRSWSFDQEEGQLDNRRIARLLVPGKRYAVFRQESDSPTPEACVTLLVDQSGSMDARRRQMAALAIDLAVHTLESCRINCEVLGYTTRYAADSPIVAAWRRAGSPAGPGRLNAIRHIVYKTAIQPWRRCRPHLGLLLRDGFGQENIDGEALDWAARRLSARPESRKILVVLSDGAPYDAATSLAHHRSYLEDHLRQVIAAIEASPIHLAALGTGQDVGRFYRHALTLRHSDEVAERLFDHLGDLLTRPSSES